MISSRCYFDEETKVIHSETDSADLDDRGVGYALFHNMKNSADQDLIAQIDAATGHRDSFKYFLTRCIRMAISMRKFGIESGDIISICSYNHLNSAVPYVAGYFIGATIAPTDPTISLEDQRHLLNLVKPKMIFVSRGTEDLIEEALSILDFKCEIVAFSRTNENKYKLFHSFTEQQEGEENFEPVIAQDPTATCLILFSSGTTGLAKGICLNHYFVMNTFTSMANMKGKTPMFMLYSTLYWISAILFQTVCFYYGFERLVCTHFDPQLMWEYVAKYKVDVLFLAPIHAIKSLEYLHKREREPLQLKRLLMGGSSIAPNFMQRLRDLLPTTFIANGYGQTEVGIISIFKSIDDENYQMKLESVGYLAPNLITKIVDPDTEEILDLKQKGEIRIKSQYSMNGYYNQDSANSWDDDGYIKTGDLGYFDDQLCLYITDRIKEMFKYMSWHIVPAKLEAILYSHPDVHLAIVIGIPHPTEDNHAVGAVTLIPNATVTADELESYVEERVDERNRLRAGVVILDSMPMTPTGKIMRRESKDILKKMVKIRE